MADIRETLHVSAPASAVFWLVADLPRMGEWSPECERVIWRGGFAGPVKGARFLGINRSGTLRWVTAGRITAFEPGRYLAFEVGIGPVPMSLWEYFVVPDRDGTGCTIAQQWTDRRHGAARTAFDRIWGARVHRNKQGMRATLLAIKRVAEGSVARPR